MAAQDLTTIANLKLWLPINTSNTADDTSIARLITATSQDFMRATKRPDLLEVDYTEVHQGDGASRMIVFHWPIVGVTSLEVSGSAITASSDKIVPGYYFDADIDPERIWELYLNGYVFTDGAAVKIEYSAGYLQPGETPSGGQIALPGDIEQAVIDWCTYRYNERPNVAATERRSTDGESIQSPLLDAPPNVLAVIERYTRVIPSVDRRAEEREERTAKGGAKMPARKK